MRRILHVKCGSQSLSLTCTGMFSAPVALGLYAVAFERAGALDKLEAFASFNGPDFYGECDSMSMCGHSVTP